MKKKTCKRKLHLIPQIKFSKTNLNYNKTKTNCIIKTQKKNAKKPNKNNNCYLI